MMSHRTTRLAICLLVLLFGVDNLVSAQCPANSTKNQLLAATQLESVQIQDRSIGQLFSELSLFHDIPIGLAIATNDDEFASYGIDFKKGKLSDLLTQFVTQHDQYAWEIKEGVVNVFPKDNYRDPLLDQLLCAEVRSFSIEQKTSVWNLENSLVSSPEIKSILEANGTAHRGGNLGGFYIPQVGRDFTLEVSNITLKSILNRVIKESPVVRFWVIRRNFYDQTVLLRLGAQFEDVPVSDSQTSDPTASTTQSTEDCGGPVPEPGRRRRNPRIQGLHLLDLIRRAPEPD